MLSFFRVKYDFVLWSMGTTASLQSRVTLCTSYYQTRISICDLPSKMDAKEFVLEANEKSVDNLYYTTLHTVQYWQTLGTAKCTCCPFAKCSWQENLDLMIKTKQNKRMSPHKVDVCCTLKMYCNIMISNDCTLYPINMWLHFLV